MIKALQKNRDYYAGGLLVFIGGATILQSLQYAFGTLEDIGPGVFPFVMGIILALSGLAIAVAARAPSPDEDDHSMSSSPQWRGWGCIIAGFLSFMILAKTVGLFPATFACVFISALGDRQATLKGSFILATLVAIFGSIVFYYILHIPLPPFAR